MHTFRNATVSLETSETIALMTQRNIHQDDYLAFSVAGIFTALQKSYVPGKIVELRTGARNVEIEIIRQKLQKELMGCKKSYRTRGPKCILMQHGGAFA
jgi:hypothetical protein